MPAKLVTLLGVERSRRAVFLRFGVDDLRFSTTHWYEQLDLDALARTHGEESVERLLFHVAMFELNKLCSLRPERVSLGPWTRFLTPALLDLWREVFVNVWAQWRYENDDPDYLGPDFDSPTKDLPAPLAPVERAEVDALVFCGGGKDSLATMRLLEASGLRFDTLGYAASIYGPADAQHALIDGLVSRCAPRRHLRQWVYDDFVDAPVLKLVDGAPRTLTAAETPSSVFAALPLAVQHGYARLALGHERSADAGQRRWERTGEIINHQWGKSRAAEALIDRYVREHLVAGVECFSPLRPIHDVVIFGSLRRWPDDVPFTHSCNLKKPWCLRCPKCLYVWLGCAAMLPREVVRATFGDDGLLADPSRTAGFEALLGEYAQPFECIGHAAEARIYLAACAARGYEGETVTRFVERYGAPRETLALAEGYTDVDVSALPEALRGRLGAVLERVAQETRGFLRGL